jgi:glutamyl-Q tRNA(Asp) synthetase
VVDDAAQGVTHVVRGQDLADNTARQIVLQRALGLPQPQYLHTPLVVGLNGEKLSKQNGAQSVDTTQPIKALDSAGRVLGLGINNKSSTTTPAEWLQTALVRWKIMQLANKSRYSGN